MIAVPMNVSASNVSIPMSVSASNAVIPVALNAGYSMLKYDTYEGSYIFTPSTSEQVINTEQKALMQNIVINPIPPNYGLITYNGSTITVS